MVALHPNRGCGSRQGVSPPMPVQTAACFSCTNQRNSRARIGAEMVRGGGGNDVEALRRWAKILTVATASEIGEG